MDKEVMEIVRVMEDGTQKKVEKGAVIELEGDDIHMDFLNAMAEDVVRICIGINTAVKQMGLDELVKKVVEATRNSQRGDEGE